MDYKLVEPCMDYYSKSVLNTNMHEFDYHPINAYTGLSYFSARKEEYM